MTRGQIETHAVIAARIAGCNCDVEVVVEELEPLLYAGHCHHDEWCRLLRRRTAQWN